MKRTWFAAAAAAAALVVTAAPAQADPAADFLGSLGAAGLAGLDPMLAVDAGRDICPMLVEPGQNLANVAAGVAERIGRPLGPATLFTGLAISTFCPGAVSAIANGESPIPLNLLGLL